MLFLHFLGNGELFGTCIQDIAQAHGDCHCLSL